MHYSNQHDESGVKHQSMQARVLTEAKRKLIKRFLLSEADLWRVEHAGYSLSSTSVYPVAFNC